MDNPLQSLAVAGGVLYGLLRLPLAVFYNRLGVSPEDVGYDQITVLLQSFIILAIIETAIAVSVVAFVFVFFPPLVALDIEAFLEARESARLRRALLLLSPWCLAVVLLAVAVRHPVWAADGTWLAVGACLSLCTYGLLRVIYRKLDRRVWSTLLRQRRDWYRQRMTRDIVVNMATFGLAVMLVGLPLLAAYDAGQVLEGREARLMTKPWRATAVTVMADNGVADRLRRLECSELRLLGMTDKAVVILEWRTRDVHNVRRDKVDVSLRGRCP